MTIDEDFAGLRMRGSRDTQQDYYAFCPVEPAGLLLVVADGAGGLAGGGEASRGAVEGFMDAFFAGPGDGPRRLAAALAAANRRVGEVTGGAPAHWEEAGAASTLVAVHVTARWFEWVSVGDSLLLHVRAGTLLWRNADHSMRAAAGPDGPARNTLRSALTGAPIPVVDEGRLPWREGDVLLAGSDGLLGLTEAGMAAAAVPAGQPALQCAQRLRQAVVEQANPRQDNVTVAVLRHHFPESASSGPADPSA